jgi:hypothetical protein
MSEGFSLDVGIVEIPRLFDVEGSSLPDRKNELGPSTSHSSTAKSVSTVNPDHLS